MRDLSDIHYPDADQIRVVMDNLSTHTAGALYETFPAPEAHRILQRLEFHYTPKHASWLNMVEIEIGVLRGQCLDRRIGDRAVLNTEVAAWQRQRNASGARIKWKFTTQKARQKLARAYPDTAEKVKITVTRCPRTTGRRQAGQDQYRATCRSASRSGRLCRNPWSDHRPIRARCSQADRTDDRTVHGDGSGIRYGAAEPRSARSQSTREIWIALSEHIEEG